MAKPFPEEQLKAILKILEARPEGTTLKSISEALGETTANRTLQHHLQYLVAQGRAVSKGIKRGMRYFPLATPTEEETQVMSLSNSSQKIQKYLMQDLIARKVVGYSREFLNSYRPNKTAYLSKQDLSELHSIGAVPMADQPAGTYARKILDRLLIDLSWNSSRLEGNTYSLLDTRRLIDFGKEAQGKDRIEAQMILNHKDAIEFLVNNASEIGFNRFTIRNLHGLLANNLLPDLQSAGRLRTIEVAITQSVFQPLAVPQLIEEYFDQLLATASAITDPFEQSFFVMVQLPYLQPFDDVNKRVSRLAANIPLIKANLIPLTFNDVPRSLYAQAMLGVYELSKVDLLRDVFLWAYRRSAERYAAARQSLGEPDPFRLQFRDEIRAVVGSIIKNRSSRAEAFGYLETWILENLPDEAREEFQKVVEDEILSLHEGNFARFQVRPSEFEAWQKVWDSKR